MNREIKFRGKAECSIERLNEIGIKHDNGWVYGHSVMYGETPYIVGDFVEVDEEYTFNEFWVKVYSESVGQYIGLKDKNGKEIFEGDIIEAENRLWQIGFRDGCFVGVDFKNVAWDELVNISYGETKVIGNIFENSELLEVANGQY